jgi:hypothetical protein
MKNILTSSLSLPVAVNELRHPGSLGISAGIFNFSHLSYNHLMRLVRVIWFLISVAIGLAVGLAYGWLAQPARYANTTPDTLRADYKADYALMVAEIYKKEGSVALAVHRLSQISSDPPVRLVQQAILTGRQLDYSSRDMDMLARLAEVLQTWTPASTGSNP